MEQLIQALVDGLVLSSLYAIVALGLTITFGVLEVVNFSHGQLVTLAAYLAFTMVTAGISFWLAIPLVMVCLILIGMVMEIATFRPVRSVPINGLLVSIGWIAIFTAFIHILWGPNQLNLDSVFRGSSKVLGISLNPNNLLVIALALVVMGLLAVLLRMTMIGKMLRATAQNREAAALLGVRVGWMNTLAFSIGAAMAGLAGVLLANLFPITPALGDSYMVFAFVALVIGGAGSAVGAVLGSLVVGMAVALAQTFGTTAVASTLPFIVLIIVLLFRPRGLIRTESEASL